MKARLLWFISAAVCVLIGGCASSNSTNQASVTNSVYKHAAYPHSAQELHDAYLAATREMGLELVSTAPSRIEARSKDSNQPTNVVIEISPADTLVTAVLITSDYVMSGKQYTHYPYELSYKAFRHLDKEKGYAYVYQLEAVPDRPVLLLWDRAPWHRGAAIRALLAEHPRLELMPFPVASPELNPQEQVWKATRQEVSHNHDRSKLDQLADSFEHHLRTRRFPCSLLDRYGFTALRPMFT